MKRIRKSQKLFPVVLLFVIIAMTMSGCSYVNNKSWDAMTSEEQEEARQAFKDERKELEEDFSDDSFAQYILDKVEQAMEY